MTDRADATGTFAEARSPVYIPYLYGPPHLLSDTIKSIHQFVSVYAKYMPSNTKWKMRGRKREDGGIPEGASLNSKGRERII